MKKGAPGSITKTTAAHINPTKNKKAAIMVNITNTKAAIRGESRHSNKHRPTLVKTDLIQAEYIRVESCFLFSLFTCCILTINLRYIIHHLVQYVFVAVRSSLQVLEIPCGLENSYDYL
jgi:hypothetical protein